ncbi:MAG: winged helix-turn-helix transcriptional regulator [Hyphomicrobiaceae bacterium]
MRYLLFALFASAGAALAATNMANNAIAINDGAFVWNDLTAIIVGLGITGSLLSLALGAIVKRSMITAFLAVIVIFGCTIVSVTYTLTRLGSVADAGISKALAHNARIKRTKDQIGDLIRKLDEQRREAARECRNYKPGRSDKRRFPLCLTARGLIGDYECDLETAKATLTALGAPRVADSAGSRIEALFGGVGITAERYRRAHPALTAGTLEFGVNLLLMVAGLFAASGRFPESITINAKPVDPVSIALQRGPASNRELAKRIGWTETRTSRAVQRLANQRLVTVSQDGRGKRIALTA